MSEVEITVSEVEITVSEVEITVSEVESEVEITMSGGLSAINQPLSVLEHLKDAPIRTHSS